MSEIVKPTTVYLDAETAQLAQEMAATMGQPVSHLFREVLRRMRDTLGGIDEIAVFLRNAEEYSRTSGDDAEEKRKPSPLPLGPMSEPSRGPYPIDSWIDVGSTERVFLMGATLAQMIVRHKGKWQDLLRNGKRMQVLLQGNLQTMDFTPAATPAKRLYRDQLDSLAVLHELAADDTNSMLDVRKSSNKELISYSALFVFKSDGNVDIQIQPYVFHRCTSILRGPRFMLSTRFGGDVYRILVAPIQELWQRSVQALEPGTN